MTQPTPDPTPAPAVITTPNEPAYMTPLTRWLRTALQVATALVIAIPTATAAFGVSATTSAKLVGYMAGLVALVGAVHNAVNHQAAKAK